MGNEEIAAVFFEIADILEMQGIQWKPQAYRKAAMAIRDLNETIAEIYAKGGRKALEEIPGVGENISKKIEEIVKTGELKYLKKLRKSMPVDVEALNAVPGLGPKKTMVLYKKLGIKNLDGLKKAALQHKISKLPGFGEKSEADILAGLAVQAEGERIPIEKALPIANEIKKNMQQNCKAALKVEVAGSLRRKKATVHDIDVLVATNEPEKVMDFFTTMKNVKEVVMKGKTKSSIRVTEGIQVDLRAVKPEQWGSALLYFTGSKQHNISLRRIAQKKGWKISEYGLFKGDKVLAGKTEEEIYNALGMAYIKPEEREDEGEIERAIKEFRKEK